MAQGRVKSERSGDEGRCFAASGKEEATKGTREGSRGRREKRALCSQEPRKDSVWSRGLCAILSTTPEPVR